MQKYDSTIVIFDKNCHFKALQSNSSELPFKLAELRSAAMLCTYTKSQNQSLYYRLLDYTISGTHFTSKLTVPEKMEPYA